MTEIVKMTVGVTRDDAVKFLEQACRNWQHVPQLSNEDIADVMVTLAMFARKHSAAAVGHAGKAERGDPLRGALEGSFCVTESNGHPEPTSRSYRMIFSFPTMEAMHAAHAAYITGEPTCPTNQKTIRAGNDPRGELLGADDSADRKQQMDALWKVLREYRLEDGQTVAELIKSGHDRISILAGLADVFGDDLPTLNARDDEPAAWTGSGSMAALKDGREGFIWPAKADAHPIPLYARPPGEVVSLQLDRKVGMYGSAYDPPGPCRAYTYEHQPSNLPAYSLGQAHAAAAAMSAGDNIDRGLGLLKALEEQGFGVFEIEREDDQ